MIRKALAIGMLTCAIAILAFVLNFGQPSNAGNKDYVSYWAAGHLLIAHQNPYDESAVFRLERSVGFREPQPLMMRNSPHALTLALPLGWFSVGVGAVLWSALIVIAVIVSVHMLWSLNGQPPGRLHLFGYLFAPVVACMPLGQTSAFALLGVVLFLKFQHTHPFRAGLGVSLFAIKPHLFLVFGLVVLSWVLIQKSYRLIVGAATGFLVGLAIPMLFDPSVLSHYLPVLHRAALDSRMLPTVSAMFGAIISPKTGWIQDIPAILGSAWALLYFRIRKNAWNWNTDGSLVLLVSIVVAPFAWFMDEVVVLPAIMQAIYLGSESRGALITFGLINGIALLEVISGVSVGSGYYIWTPIAWVVWYIWTVRTHKSPRCARVRKLIPNSTAPSQLDDH